MYLLCLTCRRDSDHRPCLLLFIVVVRGKLRGIGSAQHLKERFGNGYEANITLKVPSANDIATALDTVLGCIASRVGPSDNTAAAAAAAAAEEVAGVESAVCVGAIATGPVGDAAATDPDDAAVDALEAQTLTTANLSIPPRSYEVQ